jgi:hypothetical protein
MQRRGVLGDGLSDLVWLSDGRAEMSDRDEIAEIKSRHYECFIEDHESKLWTPGQCAGWAGRGLHLMRCSRKDGYGVGGMFCRQHALKWDQFKERAK